MRKSGKEQQIEKVENIWNFGLIAPRFWFEEFWNGKYKLLKIKEWVEVSTINLKRENYDNVAEFEKFSQLPKEYLIEIFESEYRDRFIDRLEELYSTDTEWPNINEEIVLKICMSFPETFYKLSNNKSVYEKYTDKYKFIYWCKLMWIGWEDEQLLWDFYQNVRCELYHFWSLWWWRNIDYQTSSGISEIDKVIYKKWWTIKCICLEKFISKIKDSINNYIDNLKNDENLYKIFRNKYVNDLNNYLDKE